jgi:hypothetical protein
VSFNISYSISNPWNNFPNILLITALPLFAVHLSFSSIFSSRLTATATVIVGEAKLESLSISRIVPIRVTHAALVNLRVPRETL